jgi:large subunit ribosomal protein L10
MSKAVKAMETDALRAAYEDVSSVCLVDLTRMNANATSEFRAELRARQLTLRVIRNRLAARAFRETPLEPVNKALVGPTALVSGGESVIDLAKALVDWAKKYPALTLRAGLVEGDQELTPIAELARMMSLGETRGALLAQLLSPGGKIAGCLSSPAGRIAGCLKAIIDGQEAGEAEAA